mmetsp:Transcript_28555/g.63502  ORF Transcript_28555/g.63502 Transcript_28555/m.63502 type:complete len:177 (+) Transcript_28555:188-718(+)
MKLLGIQTDNSVAAKAATVGVSAIKTIFTQSPASASREKVDSSKPVVSTDGGANENALPSTTRSSLPIPRTVSAAARPRSAPSKPKKSGRKGGASRQFSRTKSNTWYRTSEKKTTNVEIRKEFEEVTWDKTLTPLEIADEQRSVSRFATERGTFWSNGLMWGEVGSDGGSPKGHFV